jgi:tRNA pseudouridine38-40 synthase
MARLRLLIAYDGRPFAGWQSQPSGRTVQDTIELALTRILPDHPGVIRISASGRTDAGVHALGQVAHFDIPPDSSLSPEAWQRALNVHLPPTVRIMSCETVPDTFHSRFDARGKTYLYRLWTGAVIPPLEAGLACHHPRPIDFPSLANACRAISGTHDFSGFAAFRGNEDGSEDNVRTLWSVEPIRTGDLLEITYHGSGFLYKMVRLLTGGLLRVATGREPLSWLTGVLHRRVPGKCAHVASAAGLYLKSVDYPD